MFTLDNTIEEILEGAGPEQSLFVDRQLLTLAQGDIHGRPLRELKESVSMIWGAPFPSDDIVSAANFALQFYERTDVLPLWTDAYDLTGNAENSVFLVALKDEHPNDDAIRPAVLICPGGGYSGKSLNAEGVLTAERLQKAGYRTFVLNYRVDPNHYPLPQLDLLMAIKYLRANAGSLKVDPDDIMILGYSAGGHLCASTAALHESLEEELEKHIGKCRPAWSAAYSRISGRPDKVCLCYPVISFLDGAHDPSFQCLTGGDDSLREKLSVETQVTADYPKTFLWTCSDDALVSPDNTMRMAAALEKNHVAHACVVYPQGGHGCSLGIGTSAAGWMDQMLDYMKDRS